MSLNNSSTNDDNNNLHNRFQEFIPSQDGNHKLQNELVEQLLQEATRLSTTEIIDSKIETKMNAVSEYLDELYSQFERDTKDKNDQLAIRTSLPTLSKWNQQLLDSGKTSKILCDEIVEELEHVNTLLRRIERRKKNAKRNRVQHYHYSSNTTIMNNQLLQSCALLLLRISACTVTIDALKKLTTTQSNYSYHFQQTLHSALLSGIIMLSITYVDALHHAITQQRDDKQALKDGEQESVAYQERNSDR